MESSAIRKLDLDDALRRSIERGEVALGGLDPQTHDVVARMKEGGTANLDQVVSRVQVIGVRNITNKPHVLVVKDEVGLGSTPYKRLSYGVRI